MERKIKVLVVDDSVFMRRAISKLLSHEKIEVIDTAQNGREAIQKNLDLQPDLITLDIEMPIMNGLEALKEIMNTRPVPVLMLSTLTTDGANATLEALNEGAIDFITKKSAFNEMDSLKDDLIGKILEISVNSVIKNQMLRRKRLIEQKNPEKFPNVKIKESNDHQSVISRYKQNKISNRPRPIPTNINVICIGISTGGPAALLQVIPQLPKELPVPILIAQHMPPHFTKSLSERLNSKSQLNVKEAENGEMIKPGTVYIAKGGMQLSIKKNYKIDISNEPFDELYKPSVDVLFKSVADVYKNKVVSLIMTGMGHDGYHGTKLLRSIGAYSIAQSIDSSIAPGMPETIISKNEVDEIYSLDHIPEAICSFFGLKPIA